MNICVFDLETTSLDVKTANILEVAIIDYNTGDIIQHSYIYPHDDITIDNTNIHGIDMELLGKNNAITLIEFTNNFESIINNYYGNDSTVYIIAHNNFNYDQLVLEYNFMKINKKINLNLYFVDSILIVKEIFPKLYQYNLKTLAEKFILNHQNIKFHTALDDTKALAQIIRNIFNINTLLLSNFEMLITKHSRPRLRGNDILGLSLNKIQGLYNFGDITTIKLLIDHIANFDNENLISFLKETFQIKRIDKINKIVNHLDLIKI